METSINTQMDTLKPGSVKAITYLTIFKLVLAMGFYLAFTVGGLVISGANPTFILYTFGGYAVMAVFILMAISRRKLVMLRVAIIADFIVSIPTTAVIGFVVSLVSLGLTFNKKARAYFNG